jgi:DNA-binding CsgD family transcriptional regulator
MSSHLVPTVTDSGTSAQSPQWFTQGLFPSVSLPAKQLLNALANSPIGIAICDRRLRFSAVNRRLAEINNIPPDEHPGRPVRCLIGDLASTVEARLRQVFSTGRPLRDAPLVGQLGANPEKGQWLEHYFPLLDPRGRVERVGVFVISIPGLWFPADPNKEPSGLNSLLRELASRSGTTMEASDRLAIAESQRPSRKLSARETDVLKILARGFTTKEIASELAISAKTVETYRSRLMLKLAATSVAQLVHYAIRNHLVDLQG